MNINMNSITLIILGIIALCCPFLVSMTYSVFSGFVLLMIALLLFISAINIFKFHRVGGIVAVVLAIISLIFSFIVMFNPALISAFISFLVYIIGCIMIISGIYYVFLARLSYNPLLVFGISNILFGSLYIIIGSFIYNPINLSLLIGMWLICTGLFSIIFER